MAAPTRTADQREFDKAQIAALMRRGTPRRAIIRTFTERSPEAGNGPPVSYNQVLYDIKQVMGELAAEREADNAAILAVALEEIREVKQEAWQEWEASKQPVTRYTKDGDAYEVREPQERYLRLIYDCVVKECELQGVKIPPPKDDQASGFEGLLEVIGPVVTEVVLSMQQRATPPEEAGPRIVSSVVQQLRDQAAHNTGTAPELPVDQQGSLEDYLAGS